MIAGSSPRNAYELEVEAQKKLVEELKIQWKLLWLERFDDKQLAEGVSVNDYSVLRVEKGTVIHATRDFKALSFKEILEQQKVENPDRFIQPSVQVGGWNRFIKNEITSQNPTKGKRAGFYLADKPVKSEVQQPKKGGRGWLHKT